MPNPHMNRHRFCTQPGLRFPRGSSKRELPATQLNRILADSLEESKINRKLGVCTTIEADVVADGGIAILQSCDKPIGSRPGRIAWPLFNWKVFFGKSLS